MATGSNNIVRTIDIAKNSSSDKRLYRGLLLENGLTALLVSDPDVKISAASLTITVGSLSVPNDMAGIANLCDHLLYLGTRKYPTEHSFETFLAQNGGTSFTIIGSDHINYNFSVKENVLIEGLDRFSQFFIAPLFTPSAIKRQIMKTVFQHYQNINSDYRRIDQMIRNGADPNHPVYQNYITGTKNTLIDQPLSNNVSIYEEVVKFIFKWYSSHLMYLTIFGKEDLNVLEQQTLSCFGQIKKKNVDMPRWDGKIYNTEQLTTKTMVVPLRDISELHVYFPIPDQAEYYESKPTWFLRNLFQHEGLNSILGILKKRRWCYELHAGRHREARGIELFRIRIVLSKEGLHFVDDIIKLIFQYVNMLKRKKLPIRFYEEYGKLRKLKFDFHQKKTSIKYTSYLSIEMTMTRLEDITIATEEIKSWCPHLIRELLSSYFRPNNMRIIVISKTFENFTNTIDCFFGTQYKTTKIPIETLEMWQEDDVCPDLTLPPRNKFITSVERLVDVDGNEPDQPMIYYESGRLKCWLKKDTEFRLPQSFVSIIFFCNNITTEVDEFILKYLFLNFIKNDITCFMKDARQANLNVDMKSTYKGYHVIIDGSDDNFHIFLQQFIDKLTTYKIDPMHFTLNKENIVEKWKNDDDTSSFNLAMSHQNVFLKRLWTPKQIKEAANSVTVEHMEEFIKTFQTHTRMEMLLYGNVDDKKALKLVKILEKPFLNHETIFNIQPFFQLNETNLQFEDDTHSIHMDVHGDYLSNSCACLIFYCGDYSPKNAIIIKLFNAITKIHLWLRLRIQLFSQFQHKFTVYSNCYTCFDALFITYAVQSEHDPPSLAEKIEEFIDSIWRWCPCMPNDLFDTWKNKLEAQLLKKVGSMQEQMNIYRYEFTQRMFEFNRAQTEVDALRSVTKTDLLRFYRKYIKQTGLKRRTYSIYVQPTTRRN